MHCPSSIISARDSCNRLETPKHPIALPSSVLHPSPLLPQEVSMDTVAQIVATLASGKASAGLPDLFNKEEISSSGPTPTLVYIGHSMRSESAAHLGDAVAPLQEVRLFMHSYCALPRCRPPFLSCEICSFFFFVLM